MVWPHHPLRSCEAPISQASEKHRNQCDRPCDGRQEHVRASTIVVLMAASSRLFEPEYPTHHGVATQPTRSRNTIRLTMAIGPIKRLIEVRMVLSLAAGRAGATLAVATDIGASRHEPPASHSPTSRMYRRYSVSNLARSP
jgi:hypothetical protein